MLGWKDRYSVLVYNHHNSPYQQYKNYGCRYFDIDLYDATQISKLSRKQLGELNFPNFMINTIIFLERVFVKPKNRFISWHGIPLLGWNDIGDIIKSFNNNYQDGLIIFFNVLVDEYKDDYIQKCQEYLSTIDNNIQFISSSDVGFNNLELDDLKLEENVIKIFWKRPSIIDNYPGDHYCVSGKRQYPFLIGGNPNTVKQFKKKLKDENPDYAFLDFISSF